MKTIKMLLVVLAITFTNVISANNPVKGNLITEDAPSVAREISALLVKPNFVVKNELNAKVTFLTHEGNKIVVLKVDTENEQLEAFIKTRLNYNTLSTKLKNNKVYEIKVKVVVQ